MDTQSLSGTWVTDLLFLSTNARYSGLIILILSAAIVALAVYRGANVLAGVFAFLLVSILALIVLSANRTPDSGLGFSVVMRHAGQVLRIFPYVVILWMLIKIDGGKGSQQDSRAHRLGAESTE